MKRILCVLGLAVAVLARAEPPDRPALPDGGSLVTSTGGLPGDGGGPWITVDVGVTVNWRPAIRCSAYAGSPAVHFRFSSDAGTATLHDSVIDVDRTMDLPLWQGGDEKFRYLSLLGQDGGAPACNVFRNPL